MVQILTVLPNPPAQVMKEIQDMFYKFLWDGKPDKIKGNVIINNYEEGELKLPHYIINILSQPIWLNFNVKRNGIFFLLLTNIVIMVSFLLMILSLKTNSACHLRKFKTNI